MNFLKIAQRFNDATPWLKCIKERIPLRGLLYTALVRSSKRSLMRASFNDHYVDDRLRTFVSSGEPVFYVLLPESIGDMIACEPIVRYLKSIRPNASVKWLVRRPLAQAIETNSLISEIIPIDSLKEGVELCTKAEANGSGIVLWCRLNRTQCRKTGFVFFNPVNPLIDISNYYSLGNLLEAFCRTAGLPPLREKPRYELEGTHNLSGLVPRSYVVVHCNSTEASRNWNPTGWKCVIDDLMARGFHIVEVGTEKVIESENPLYCDLTGMRHIPDVVKTIAEACFFMGCDSCFAHAANAVETESIILLGKYLMWDEYNPYSGDFAREHFTIVRADRGKPVSCLPAERVLDAMKKLVQRH